VLAKIRRASFSGVARPGQQLRYEATIETITEQAAQTSGIIYCNGEELGRVDLMFSHIDNNMSGLNFPNENFVFTEDFKSLLRLYKADAKTGSNA
jgi:hypothetical protein